MGRRITIQNLAKTGFFIALFWLLTGSALSFAAFSDKDRQDLSLLKGFTPGTAISYSIVSAGRAPLSGQTKADAAGEAVLPVMAFAQEDDSYTAYEIRMAPPGGAPWQVLLTYDPLTRSVSVEGSGLAEFQSLSFASQRAGMNFKTDWAGLFSQQNIPLAEKGKPQFLKLAFGAYGVQADAQAGFLPVIEIAAASGGAFSGSPGIIYVNALRQMTEQLSAVMMQQVQIIGSFFDAGLQLRTQRDMQALQARAHKDYYPGEQMCRFGSYARGLVDADFRAAYSAQALNKVMMDRALNIAHGSTSDGASSDMAARRVQFKEAHCDVTDNNNGLGDMCGKGPKDKERVNKDLDFTRTLWNPLTLDMDFEKAGPDDSGHKADIIAMAKNIYWSEAYQAATQDFLRRKPETYYDARRLLAANNVAHNSFAQLAGMKAQSRPAAGGQSGGASMKAMLEELGLPDEEILALMGENPSYYAQMEVLTKKIYQNPNFYTNLYDKPVNIDRVATAMQALQLMQMRDQHESMMRREILSSLILEQELRKNVSDLNAQMQRGMKTPPQ